METLFRSLGQVFESFRNAQVRFWVERGSAASRTEVSTRPAVSPSYTLGYIEGQTDEVPGVAGRRWSLIEEVAKTKTCLCSISLCGTSLGPVQRDLPGAH